MSTENREEFEAAVAETLRLFKVAYIAVKNTDTCEDQAKQLVMESLRDDLQRLRATRIAVVKAVEAAEEFLSLPDGEDVVDFEAARRQIRDLPEAES